MKDENSQSAQTQRLASLGFMLASVCHEVSNPLAAVSSRLQILQSKRGVTPETMEKGLASSEANIARVHKLNARRVYETILELQGLFIKVGQLLSIMANFLPSEFRAELEGLQDQVPPRRFAEIKARVEEEFNAPVDEVFADFHREPIASASLGQVHEAKTKDGTRVVVNGEAKGIVAGDDFHRALLRIWLGDQPADTSLKKAMLGG